MRTGRAESSLCTGRVYREIKARVVACDFEQGKPIHLKLLAEQLGVSTTPVREALNMLAAKGLVFNQPHKGFVAMSLSEDRLIGLYHLNQVLLKSALTERSDDSGLSVSVAVTIATIGNKLDKHSHHNPEAIANYSGDIFSCIGAIAKHAPVADTIDRINDGLYYVRTLECKLWDSVPVELMHLCELILAERFSDLSEGLVYYHDKRLKALPSLIELLEK